MSADNWPAVAHVHGRVEWRDEVTVKVATMTELVTAAARRKRIARLGVAVAVLVAVLFCN